MNKNFIIILSIFITLASNAQIPNLLWAKQMGGNSPDTGKFITTDASGNIYITGGFWGTADFDPGPAIFNLTSAGMADIFVQKLDSNGNFLWVKQMGSSGGDWGVSSIVDVSGNVYTTGWFRGMVDFDSGPGVHNLTSAGQDDIFIQKLDSNGEFIWAKRTGGSGTDRGYAFTADSRGNIYTTGYFTNTVDFDPGSNTWNITSFGFEDIYIQKLDSDGNFLWAKGMGESQGGESGRSIACDENDNIYTAGFFFGLIDFDPGAGVHNLTSEGFIDIFIQKLDSDSNFLWAKRMGGVHPDAGFSVTIDVSGNVYSTGSYEGLVDFDPGPAIYNINSEGLNDIYIQKLDSDGNFLWVKSMGGSGTDSGRAVHSDANGNVYTIGEFTDIVDADPGLGIHNLISEGFEDIFIQKLDANGDYLLAVQMGGSEFDYGGCITTDPSGNVYSTGSFQSIVDFDPGQDVYNLTSAGSSDIFVQKLSSTLGLNNFIKEASYIVYPNPTNGILNMKFINIITPKIFIYDVTGKLVYDMHLSVLNNLSQIDISYFESGFYTIKIQQQNEVFTTKIMKN